MDTFLTLHAANDPSVNFLRAGDLTYLEQFLRPKNSFFKPLEKSSKHLSFKVFSLFWVFN